MYIQLSCVYIYIYNSCRSCSVSVLPTALPPPLSLSFSLTLTHARVRFLAFSLSFALARSLLLNRRWVRMEGAQGRRQGRDPLPTTHGRHQPASSNHGRLLQHHYNNNPAPQDLLQGYVFPPTCTHILSLRPPPAPIPHFLSFPPSLVCVVLLYVVLF